MDDDFMEEEFSDDEYTEEDCARDLANILRENNEAIEHLVKDMILLRQLVGGALNDVDEMKKKLEKSINDIYEELARVNREE